MTVHPSPLADAGPDQFICYGEEVEIGGSMESQEDWTFMWEGPSLSEVDMARPVVSPTKPSWYSLTITNSHDCRSQDSVFVHVYPELVAGCRPGPYPL